MANKHIEIPCLVLAHGLDDINILSIESIINCDNRLRIDIVHNPFSAEDGSAIAYAKKNVADGILNSLTLFDDNISNNAVLLYLLANRDRYSSDIVVLSDGDILAPPKLLDEQSGILERHQDVFACGLRIDASLWSDELTVKAESLERYNTKKYETEDYVKSATGLWMTMFRGPELFKVIDGMVANGIRFTDGNLKQFAQGILQKSWVATKYNIGRELNRERHCYYVTKAESTRNFGDHSPEPTGSNYATWNHDYVSPANEWVQGGERRITFPPLPPARPRFRATLDADPVVMELSAGEAKVTNGYLAKNVRAATRSGLAFILSGPRCHSSFRLSGDRTVIFLSETKAEPGSAIYELTDLDAGAALLSRPLPQALNVLKTVQRFLADGCLISGFVFVADTLRNQINDGQTLFSKHLWPDAKELVTSLAKGWHERFLL